MQENNTLFLKEILKLKFNTHGWSEPLLDTKFYPKIIFDIEFISECIVFAKKLSSDYYILNKIKENFIVWEPKNNGENICNTPYTHFSLEDLTSSGKYKKYPVKLMFWVEIGKNLISGRLYYFPSGAIGKFSFVNRKNKESFLISGKSENGGLRITNIKYDNIKENIFNKIIYKEDKK